MNIDEIEAVFGKAKYPEEGFPGDERPSEWEYIYDQLRGKHWHDLAVEDLDAQGGVSEGINCLSADTFVYFLPGLIKLASNDTSTMSTRYCIASGIASRLTCADYRAAEKSADKESVLALLSFGQRQFLIKFLQDAMQQEPTLCPVVVNSAIHNLEQGTIDVYRDDDVLQWAAQFKSRLWRETQ